MINKSFYFELRDNIEDTKTLVAVSKTKPIEDIDELYNLGQRDFGENKVQELLGKIPNLPGDIRWHLIGPLQRNKVNKIVGNVSLIHSVSSLRLLEKINSRAEELNICQNVLIQINIDDDNNKNGLNLNDVDDFFKNLNVFHNVEIKGIMTIGKQTEELNFIRESFRKMNTLFYYINKTYSLNMTTLSMGMSKDYKIALDEGSTMIRVGSLIFGSR